MPVSATLNLKRLCALVAAIQLTANSPLLSEYGFNNGSGPEVSDTFGPTFVVRLPHMMLADAYHPRFGGSHSMKPSEKSAPQTSNTKRQFLLLAQRLFGRSNSKPSSSTVRVFGQNRIDMQHNSQRTSDKTDFQTNVNGANWRMRNSRDSAHLPPPPNHVVEEGMTATAYYMDPPEIVWTDRARQLVEQHLLVVVPSKNHRSHTSHPLRSSVIRGLQFYIYSPFSQALQLAPALVKNMHDLSRHDKSTLMRAVARSELPPVPLYLFSSWADRDLRDYLNEQMYKAVFEDDVLPRFITVNPAVIPHDRRSLKQRLYETMQHVCQGANPLVRLNMPTYTCKRVHEMFDFSLAPIDIANRRMIGEFLVAALISEVDASYAAAYGLTRPLKQHFLVYGRTVGFNHRCIVYTTSRTTSEGSASSSNSGGKSPLVPELSNDCRPAETRFAFQYSLLRSGLFSSFKTVLEFMGESERRDFLRGASKNDYSNQQNDASGFFDGIAFYRQGHNSEDSLIVENYILAIIHVATSVDMLDVVLEDLARFGRQSFHAISSPANSERKSDILSNADSFLQVYETALTLCQQAIPVPHRMVDQALSTRISKMKAIIEEGRVWLQPTLPRMIAAATTANDDALVATSGLQDL